MTDNVSAEQLKQYLDRIENLETDKKGVSDDIKDVYAEAKGTGFDTKAMRKVIKLRKQSKADRDAEEAILQTYRDAIGMT